MQTFLPYKNFTRTSKCLDYKRLGKQRLEAFDIIYLCYRHKGIDKRKEMNKSKKQAEYLWKRYKHHPAVLMWIGYTNALKLYYNTIRSEWIKRSYNNTMPYLRIHGKTIMPFWMGSRKFHAGHKSNLLRKDFNFYSKYGWNKDTTISYFWPIRKGV